MNRVILIFFLTLCLTSCKKEIDYGTDNFITDDYQKSEKEFYKYYGGKRGIIISDLGIKKFIDELHADTTDNDKLDILKVLGRRNLNWIENNDLKYLISKINSKEKAKCVMDVFESNIPDSKNMTIGNQIISIIETYRSKENYPRYGCECKIYDQDKIDEILKWWKNKNGS
ncbi:hypothetical protein GZ212_15865 [Mangrovimonas sp. CR14]|uniref:hypothetical protein n=1 Tax=Mangrovimonas sp. CR14 TaxID=2706120 RepID=UPI00141F6E1E|nr:hypothetical protein [Mangrovimonas sp. CR14]NIK93637.1 hypothetical protein [Mangrovimonas sp. CR14]